MKPHGEVDPSPGDVEAARWAIRSEMDKLSAEEQLELQRWLQEPGNLGAFERARATWRNLGVLGDEPEIIAQRSMAMEALRDRDQVRRSSRWWSTDGRWWAGLAASLLVMIGATIWLSSTRPQEYATGRGERRNVLLSDGSRLSLDADTKVEVALSADKRVLRLLAGRAKFAVAQDLGRPFTVTAADRSIIATGTVFSVELVARRVQVILYGGRVVVLRGELSAARDMLAIKAHPVATSQELVPGERLDAVVGEASRPKVQGVDPVKTLDWERGLLNFTDEPLSDAVEQMNRYAEKPIILQDRTIASIRVDGVFKAGDTETFAEAVAEENQFGLRHDEGNIILLRPVGS